MTQAVAISILGEILDLARKTLQPFPLLSLKERKIMLENSTIFETLPSRLSKIYRPELHSFKLLLLGKHPIFESDRFLTILEYNPLEIAAYYSIHRSPETSPQSDNHGNNYVFANTNLRNGVIFTYHDLETDSYIPVTFNTNAPICFIAIPYKLNGKAKEIIERMVTNFHTISKQNSLRNFPLVVKGITKKTVTSIELINESAIIEHEDDVSTVTAEENFPALSYKIQQLKKMVATHDDHNHRLHKKPKVISVVNKLTRIVYCEDWIFDPHEANFIARKWALSKLERLEKRGITDIDPSYLIDTIVKPISQRPPGKQNTDYFAYAVRSKISNDQISYGELLGVVIASRCNRTVAALNAVVVPVNKSFRDLGYYTVYKLAEKMLALGILSYWHGPKELSSDEHAIVEFMGLPDKITKKYCLKCYTGKGYDLVKRALNQAYTSSN